MKLYALTLEFQQSIGHPIKVVCQVCSWSSANTLSNARYCPYGHGLLLRLDTALNKLELTPKELNTSFPIEDELDLFGIDPTGIDARQKCLACGMEKLLPYPGHCNTCRNPWPVRMVLCESWRDLLIQAKARPIVPLEKPVEMLPEMQLSLFAGVA